MSDTAAAPETPTAKPAAFTRYQVFAVAAIAFIQLTVILDFMVLSPLGALLLKQMDVTAARFGLVVSAYAFAAGVSGFLTAGFADRFDRKRLLLFFYSGFVVGTALCGIAPTYQFLLVARVITGLFGGVIGSISLAIVTDVFPYTMRGRVMGFIQTAFAGSQVLGLPIGLFLANKSDWHAPFRMIVGLSLVAGIILAIYLRPVADHLKIPRDKNSFQHLIGTLTVPAHLQAFGATILMVTGGFMLMPFGSAFTVNNLGIAIEKLPLIYFVTGLFAIAAGPLAGRLSDTWGKFPLFCAGSAWMFVLVLIFTRLGTTPLVWVIVINVLIFMGITSRMVSGSALYSAVPTPANRGAFMAVSSSLNSIAGGIASSAAGLIVVQAPGGRLEHYPVLGYVVCVAMVLSAVLLYGVNRYVSAKEVPT